MKQTLVEIFSEIGHFGSNDIGCNDKGSFHSYLESYDDLFKPFREGGTILEIGLALGDSIKLWDRYFQNAKIVGVDITLVFQPIQYKNEVILIEADATNPEFLEQIKGLKFDIVVEDSSHDEKDQVAIFELLKPKMNSGGIYIIEDILNLELSKERFQLLHDNCQILDFRPISGKFADCLILYRF